MAKAKTATIIALAVASVMIPMSQIQLIQGVTPSATACAEAISRCESVDLKEIVTRMKGLGVTGVVIHEMDVLFTSDKYTSTSEFNDFGATVFMRVDNEKILKTIRVALGKGTALKGAAGGEYYKLA